MIVSNLKRGLRIPVFKAFMDDFFYDFRAVIMNLADDDFLFVPHSVCKSWIYPAKSSSVSDSFAFSFLFFSEIKAIRMLNP